MPSVYSSTEDSRKTSLRGVLVSPSDTLYLSGKRREGETDPKERPVHGLRVEGKSSTVGGDGTQGGDGG